MEAVYIALGCYERLYCTASAYLFKIRFINPLFSEDLLFSSSFGCTLPFDKGSQGKTSELTKTNGF